MAFPVPQLIAGQGVILVLLRQGFSHCKSCDHIFQQLDFQTALHCQLEILLELRGGLDDILVFLMLSGLRTAHPDRYNLS